MSVFPLILQSLWHGSLLFFVTVYAEKIDPLSELDVMASYRVENHPQCQRLCWYWKACGRSSFYGNNDHNSRNNCVLHGSQHRAEHLVNGWTDEEAAPYGMGPEEGCASRPCRQQEMCLPVHSVTTFICLQMTSGAWLSQSCSETCQSPPSAGKTECVHGQCLCAPGYFYSVSQRTCVSECRELSNSYLRYRKYDLAGHDEYSLKPAKDIADCKTRCSADASCVVIVYVQDWLKCHFKHTTALAHPEAWQPLSIADTYQRMCD